MARLSQLRPLGLETIKLYVALVASAGVALFVFLILAGRFDFSAEAPGVYWPGGLRRVMFALFVLLGELIPITVPRGNDTEEITTSTTFAFGLLLGWGVAWGMTALVADIVRQKPMRKILFNAGQYALAIGGAGLVYAALGGIASIRIRDLLPIL